MRLWESMLFHKMESNSIWLLHLAPLTPLILVICILHLNILYLLTFRPSDPIVHAECYVVRASSSLDDHYRTHRRSSGRQSQTQSNTDHYERTKDVQLWRSVYLVVSLESNRPIFYYYISRSLSSSPTFWNVNFLIVLSITMSVIRTLRVYTRGTHSISTLESHTKGAQ